MAQHGISGIGDVFGMSDTIWNDVQIDNVFGLGDRNYGWGVRDDFTNFSQLVANSGGTGDYVSGANTYRTYEETGGIAVPVIQDAGPTYTVPAGFPILTPQGNNAPQTTLQGTQNILFQNPAIIPTPGELLLKTSNNASDRIQMMIRRPRPPQAHRRATTSAPSRPTRRRTFCRARSISSAASSSVRSTPRWPTSLSGWPPAGRRSAAGTSTAPLASNTAYSTVPDLLGFGFLSGYTEGDLSIVFNKAGGTIQDEKVTNGTSLNLINMETYAINGTTNYVLGSSANKTAAVYFKLGFTVDFTAAGGNGTFTPFINGSAFNGRMAPSKLITNVANNPKSPYGTSLGTVGSAGGGFGRLRECSFALEFSRRIPARQ